MNAPAQERETLWFSGVMPPIAADLDVQKAGRLAMGLGISGPAVATGRWRWTDPRLSKRRQGTRRTRWVRFWWPGPPGRVADSSKASQRLLERVLSHFAYGESLAVRTRICCVVGGRPR
jgi:hypothetical protein